MVTIIHLSAAPNPLVGPPTLHAPRTVAIFFCTPRPRGGEGAGAKTRILGNFLKFSLLRVVVQIMFFRALKASKLEAFRALKASKLEVFRALKASNLAVGF